MPYGICTLNIIPCRAEPANTSEMVTQLLFGDTYTVLEVQEEWIKIQIFYDKYECWINRKQHHSLNESGFNALNKNNQFVNADLVQVIKDSASKTNSIITIGASLPFYSENIVTVENQNYTFDGSVVDSNKRKSNSELIQTSYLFLNSPYLWGGKSPFGIDCSGFTQVVYKLNGIKLPRDASQQVLEGSPLSFVEEAEAGDLAFFDNEEGNITHVGILIDNQTIIHASGKVRIDKFDHYGIFHSENKKYTHHLRVIKRIF